MDKYLEYGSIDVLSYIIKTCTSLNIDINLTKAQKILYCCYGAVLAKYGYRLCAEHPKAWQYGPAFPRAYSAHRKSRINFDSTDPISSNKCPSEIKGLIDVTIKYFGKYNASALVAWSHKPGSPWAICSNDGMNLYGDISDEIIKNYFKNNVLASAQ